VADVRGREETAVRRSAELVAEDGDDVELGDDLRLDSSETGSFVGRSSTNLIGIRRLGGFSLDEVLVPGVGTAKGP